MRCELPISMVAAIIEQIVKELPPDILIESTKKVGYYEDEHGELQFDPFKQIPEHVWQRHPGSQEPATAAQTVCNLPTSTHPDSRRPIDDPDVLQAVKESYTDLFRAVLPPLRGALHADGTAQRKRRGPNSQNAKGVWITGSGHRVYLQVCAIHRTWDVVISLLHIFA